MRRRQKKRVPSEVELNLAAMLDMAFQLLTFFVLTFKPSPVEGQISLKMPPPLHIIQQAGDKAGEDAKNPDPLAGLDTLHMSLFAKPDKSGLLEQIWIGGSGKAGLQRDGVQVEGLPGLNAELRRVLSDKGSPIRQVLIQAGSSLRYDQLMSVVDICTRQKLANGEKLGKLNFVEMLDGMMPKP